MALGDEIRDPWGFLLAGLAAGLGWAVGLPVAAAAGIGAAVFGVKVFTGGMVNREDRAGGRQLRIRSGSPEERWNRRAEQAVRSFRRLGDSVRAGPVAERAQDIGKQAEGMLAAVRRLAGQASAVREALRRIDIVRLIREEDRLTYELDRAESEEVRGEISRSLESVRAQHSVYARLEDAAMRLQARIESVVIGLEGLVARLVEILALVEAQSPVEGAQQVDELSEELEGLRAGLVETEDLSRRVLSAFQDRGTLPAGTGEGGRRRSKSRTIRVRERGRRDVEAS
ncbi:MAG: hypothetical protein M3N24_07565 [Actinomycetota bacterium]|nr:hypothetical protein [Actinomycetota bacterium]